MSVFFPSPVWLLFTRQKTQWSQSKKWITRLLHAVSLRPLWATGWCSADNNPLAAKWVTQCKNDLTEPARKWWKQHLFTLAETSLVTVTCSFHPFVFHLLSLYLIKVPVHGIGGKKKHLAQMYHLLAGVLYKSSRFIYLLYAVGIRMVTTGEETAERYWESWSNSSTFQLVLVRRQMIERIKSFKWKNDMWSHKQCDKVLVPFYTSVHSIASYISLILLCLFRHLNK